MSTRKFSKSGIAARTLVGGTVSPSLPLTPYVRPNDWPTLPTLTESDQRFVGVHAVCEGSGNFCALSAAGNYTVDWGDGVTENFAANVVAYHSYSFANAALPAATSRGYKCAVVSLTMQAGQNLTVLNLHQKHNQVGLNQYSSGFLDITIAGQYLTDLRIGVGIPATTNTYIFFTDLEQINIVRSNIKQCEYLFWRCNSLVSIVGLNTSLDVAITSAVTLQDATDTVTLVSHGRINGDSVVFSSITGTTGISVLTRYFILNATVNTFNISTSYGGNPVSLTTNGSAICVFGTNMGYMFYQCYALQTVPLFNTAACINMVNMFYQCYALQTVPLFNTAACINMRYMFYNCYALRSVPSFNTVACTNMSYMFNRCYALQTVSLLNTAACTNMNYMFNGCSALQTVSLLNTAACTNMNYMFNGCSALQTVSLLNTAACTNMGYMFNQCTALTSVPLFNTAACTDMGYMFNNCYALQTVPSFNTAACTNMSGMFSGCWALQTVSLLNTAACTTMNSMFYNCSTLQTVSLLNTAACTNMVAMFNNCYALTSVSLFNTAACTNMSYMFSSCYALQTVPLFNTVACTNMSYMFYNCYALRSVPSFNTVACTNMSYMFSGCSTLQTVPLFNTAACTNIGYMFYNCSALTSVPLFNTAACTDMSYMFSGCYALTSVPLFNTAACTTMTIMFNNCYALTSVPSFNTVACTNLTNMFPNCWALSSVNLYGYRYSLNVNSCNLSETELTKLIGNAGVAAGAQTLTISSNWGAVTPVSLSGTTTAGSVTVAMANTTGIVAGMQVTGAGTPSTTAKACSFTALGYIVTATGHGLSDGDAISFATIYFTTGISINTIYFVVGVTANTFQVATTAGGAALLLTNDGDGTLRYTATVTAISPGVSVTLSRQATAANAGAALSFRTLKTNIALLKGWTVAG